MRRENQEPAARFIHGPNSNPSEDKTYKHTCGICRPISVVTNLFRPKITDLCLGDRQDLPIEALREKDCPDSRLYLQLNFVFGLIVIEWN